MKKLVIIAGHTGVGKTKIAYDIATKLHGEIVLVDSIQSLKNLNIIANKPNKFLQATIKYHNLSIHDLSDSSLNAMKNVENIKKFITDIWQRNKTPVLEGGCGLYYNILLSGLSPRMTDEEMLAYEKNCLIAKEMIKEENYNFDILLDKVLNLDSSLPYDIVRKNDFYRLERRLADALTFGDGAYQIIREKNEQIKQNNTFFNDTNIYNIFLFNNKNIIYNNLQERCEFMLKNGLMEESMYLIKNHLNDNFLSNKNSPMFINAYGLIECIKYLGALTKYLDKKSELIRSIYRIIPKKQNIKIIPFILFKMLLNEIFISNRRYASRQLKWFRKKNNFLWLEVENEKETVQKILDEYLTLTGEEFILKADSIENQSIKELKLNYQSKNLDLDSKLPYDLLFLEKFTKKSFDFCNENKEKIIYLDSIFEKSNDLKEDENS